MNSHKRVQSMRAGRALLVGRLLEEDWTAAAAALAAGVFRRTAYKWL
ncbi:leucine zipper domain-containing protein, partial [Klebsiella quasipneumoniae]